MIKRFMSCSIFLLVFVLIVSGCSKAVSNSTYNPTIKNTETEKNGQVESQATLNTEGNNTIDKGKSEETVSQQTKTTEPLKEVKNTEQKEIKKNNKVIVIDPGHGGKTSSATEKISPDSNTMKPKNVSGATGIKSRTPEHVIALQVSMKLKELLEKKGYTVIMTRTSDKETISNIERAEVGNKNNADLVVRVHADSSPNNSVEGASMLVPGEVGYAKSIAKTSRKYGEIIFQALLEEVKMKSRGIVTRKDLTGFNWSRVPVVLIEMGFLSNPEEDKLLNSSDYQNKIALGLTKGIDEILTEK